MDISVPVTITYPSTKTLINTPFGAKEVEVPGSSISTVATLHLDEAAQAQIKDLLKA